MLFGKKNRVDPKTHHNTELWTQLTESQWNSSHSGWKGFGRSLGCYLWGWAATLATGVRLVLQRLEVVAALPLNFVHR